MRAGTLPRSKRLTSPVEQNVSTTGTDLPAANALPHRVPTMATLDPSIERFLLQAARFLLPPSACELPTSLWNIGPLFLNEPDCLRASLSRVIGLGIVLGAGLIKLPQIAKLLSSKSVDGLSATTFLVETFGYTYNLAAHYRQGYPVSTYGDFFVLLLQNYLLVWLVYAYGGRAARGSAAVWGFVGMLAVLCGEIVPVDVVQMMTLLNIPVVIVGRLPQIYANYSNGSTGQLSAITSWGIFLGASARIFTTLTDVDNMMILLGYATSATLNGIIALQVVYYWNAAPAADRKDEKKTK